MNSLICIINELILYYNCKVVVFCHPKKYGKKKWVPIGGNIFSPWKSVPNKFVYIEECFKESICFSIQDTAFSQKPTRAHLKF